MTAAASLATVIQVDTHPLALRRRAERRALPLAPVGVPMRHVAPGEQVLARTARRVALRQGRERLVERTVRVIVFRPLLSFHTLWRRWRRGVPLSRLWCAPVKPAVSSPSLDDATCRPKRSPRPAGAHRLRDLSARHLRRQPCGRADSW